MGNSQEITRIHNAQRHIGDRRVEAFVNRVLSYINSHNMIFAGSRGRSGSRKSLGVLGYHIYLKITVLDFSAVFGVEEPLSISSIQYILRILKILRT
jgi:hypothetical protein